MTRAKFLWGLWVTALSLSAPVAAQGGPSFKGREIYSWPSEDSWSFAILPGTNRSKHWDEVTSKAIDQATLLQQLQEMPAGEQLFWQAACPGAPAGRIQLPPSEVLDEVVSICAARSLLLHILSPPKSPSR